MSGQEELNKMLTTALEDMSVVLAGLEIQMLCQREDLLLLRIDILNRDILDLDEEESGPLGTIMKAFKESVENELLSVQKELQDYLESNGLEDQDELELVEGEFESLDDVWDDQWDELLDGVELEDDDD